MNEELTTLTYPHFTVELSEAFGSHCAHYRARLSHSMERIGSTSLVSVSHSRSVGGFAHSASSTKLGFDLELSSRVLNSKLSSIARYSAERELAPSLDLLWTAKEAALKALGSLEVDRLSKLFIRDWVEMRPGVFEFSVARTKEPEVALPGKGLSFRHHLYCVSIFRESKHVS